MTFNGIAIFGLVMNFSTTANPKAQQIREYPGLDGLVRVDLGARGGRTRVEGALWGSTPANLALAEGLLRAAQLDGGAYVLVDDYGVSWPSVVLQAFEPQGRVFRATCGVYLGTPVVGGYARKYRAELLHLS